MSYRRGLDRHNQEMVVNQLQDALRANDTLTAKVASLESRIAQAEDALQKGVPSDIVRALLRGET